MGCVQSPMQVGAKARSLERCRCREPPEHAIVGFERPPVRYQRSPSCGGIIRVYENIDIAALVCGGRAVQPFLELRTLEEEHRNADVTKLGRKALALGAGPHRVQQRSELWSLGDDAVKISRHSGFVREHSVSSSLNPR